MKQARLSIGCQDWQRTVMAIGAQSAGVYLFLRTLMRKMQAAEITVTIPEVAEACKIPQEAAESALRAIVAAGYFTTDSASTAEITLVCQEEAKAQADLFRKRAARLLSKTVGEQSCRQPQSRTCPGGQSGVCDGETENLSLKTYTTDFFMIYDGQSERKEKAPKPRKEKSLTETTASAYAQAPVREAELPADTLEAEYIDVCGGWPKSLRKAILAEKDDVREAFCLYVRQRQTEDGKAWTADQVRIAWLAARRIPEERRAESILAASMGKWKTIRDCGSGCYFEKDTGRVVSLVRGPVEVNPKNNSPDAAEAADTAMRLARSMRRG